MCVSLNIKVSKKQTKVKTHMDIYEEKKVSCNCQRHVDVDVGDFLCRGVGDEDVDDSKRQHRADLFVSQAGTEKLLLGHLEII